MRSILAFVLIAAVAGALPAVGEAPLADAAAADVGADGTDPSVTDPEDQFWTGFNLLNGRGVMRQPGAATPWFRRAAEQGHIRAQVHMGMAYLKGRGVEVDRGQALEWFLLAADQDHPKAQLEAGILLIEGGQGVKRDRVEAVKWLLLALRSGGPMAQAKVPPYLQSVTKAQHKQGLQRARAWRIERGLSVPQAPSGTGGGAEGASEAEPSGA